MKSLNFLEYTKHHKYTHIPSALSQIYYLNHIFGGELVKPYRDNIVLAKPFGHAAYYYIWNRLGYIDDRRYSDGVRHSEIEFVDFSDVTIGNGLGVASGLEMGNGRMTYVNMSDSQLQMGSVMEAIQFIGWHNQNIKLTIDYNRKQLTTDLMTNILPDKALFKSNRWWTFHINDDNHRQMSVGMGLPGPVVFFMDTKKGDGIIEMENDLDKWHYKSIGDEVLTMRDRLRDL